MSSWDRIILGTLIYAILMFVLWCCDAAIAIEALFLSVWLTLVLTAFLKWRRNDKGEGKGDTGSVAKAILFLFAGWVFYAMVGILPAMILTTIAVGKAETQFYQIVNAMHDYHEKHKVMPPVANMSNDNKPLLSWRVHLLPFLGEEALYEKFHLDEPWDSPHNLKLVAAMPACYHMPQHCRTAPVGHTYFQLLVGPEAFFEIGKQRSLEMLAARDGVKNTTIASYARDPVPWTKPADIEVRRGVEIPVAKPVSRMPMTLLAWMTNRSNWEPGEANRYHFMFANGSSMDSFYPYPLKQLWPYITWQGGETHDR